MNIIAPDTNIAIDILNGNEDIWIAATCIVYEIPLATNDKHFSNIEGLILIK